jgi:hypothetical protein
VRGSVAVVLHVGSGSVRVSITDAVACTKEETSAQLVAVYSPRLY